jgi:hypothetical protein
MQLTLYVQTAKALFPIFSETVSEAVKKDVKSEKVKNTNVQSANVLSIRLVCRLFLTYLYQLPSLLSVRYKEVSAEKFRKDGARTNATGFEVLLRQLLQ